MCVEGNKVSKIYILDGSPPYKKIKPLDIFEDDEDPEPDTDYFERG